MAVVDCKVYVGDGTGLAFIPNIIPIDLQEKWEAQYEAIYEALEIAAEEAEIEFGKFADHILKRHPLRILQAALTAGLYEEQEVDFDLLDHKAQEAVEEVAAKSSKKKNPPPEDPEETEEPPEDPEGK